MNSINGGERHLGLVKSEGSFAFPAPAQGAQVVFAFFGQDDAYFPVAQKAMIHLQVDDLHGVLDGLIEGALRSIPNAKAPSWEGLEG